MKLVILLLSLWICNTMSGVSVILTSLNNLFPTFGQPNFLTALTFRIVVDIFATFIVIATVMHLCGITLDRYISLFYTYSYKTIVCVRTVRSYIGVSWIVAFTASSIQWIWLYKILTNNEMNMLNDIEIWYSVATFTIFLAIPTITLAVGYVKMFIEIRSVVKRTTVSHLEISSASSKKRRVIYVFSLMYLTFGILTMPYFSLRLWIDLHFWKTGEEIINGRIAVRSMVLLRHLTSVINAVLYTVTIPDVKTQIMSLRNYFSCKLFRQHQRVIKGRANKFMENKV